MWAGVQKTMLVGSTQRDGNPSRTPSSRRLVSGSRGSQNITGQAHGNSREKSTPETLNRAPDRLLAPEVFSAPETLTRSTAPISVFSILTIIFSVTLSGIAVVVFVSIGF